MAAARRDLREDAERIQGRHASLEAPPNGFYREFANRAVGLFA